MISFMTVITAESLLQAKYATGIVWMTYNVDIFGSLEGHVEPFTMNEREL